MSDEFATKKKLRLGIEAARAGQKHVAQVHLNAVLKMEPDNIPAMLWLAFVSPSPQESLELLERVLELDPQNERAKSGVRWAKERLAAGPVSPETVASQPAATQSAEVKTPPPPTGETQPAETKASPSQADTQPEVPTAGVEALRKKLLKNDTQETAKKGVLAHRARRTIDPLTTLIIIAGALTLIALGLLGLAFVPRQTLAAWLPGTMTARVTPALPVFVKAPVKTLAPTPVVNSLAFGRDTLPVVTPLLVAVATTPPILTTSLPAVVTPTLAMATPAIEPPALLGPALPPTAPIEVTGTPTITQVVAQPALAHQPAYPGEKWIEVNVTTQQLTAWEGDQPVYSFTVSTGLPGTPTVLGEYHIYWKLTSTLMIGPNYYLPDVPYTMYFYRGYALHGTYWHHNFGQPMSHGCVNLETSNAKTLFDWAGPALPAGQLEVTASDSNPGTLVVVHQ